MDGNKKQDISGHAKPRAILNWKSKVTWDCFDFLINFALWLAQTPVASSQSARCKTKF